MKQHPLILLGAGALIGYLVGQTPWFVLFIGIALGWALRSLWDLARWTAMALGSAWARKHPERWLAQKLLRGKVPY